MRNRELNFSGSREDKNMGLKIKDEKEYQIGENRNMDKWRNLKVNGSHTITGWNWALLRCSDAVDVESIDQNNWIKLFSVFKIVIKG